MSEKFVFFWSPDKKNYGDKAVFSNWYPSKFKDSEGIEYAHVEQYMMHEKALLMGDTETALQIMETDNPARCKRLGRKVRNFDQERWLKCACNIVTNGLYLKFSQNEELKEILLRTDDKILVEASLYDTLWGIGMIESDPNVLNSTQWKGKNWLGKCLMDVRKRLNNL